MPEERNQILIIDHDNRNIYTLKAHLKSKDYSCLTSSTAEKGIKMTEENKGIGVILIDMMMPEMDGYQASQTIRGNKDQADLPVISLPRRKR